MVGSGFRATTWTSGAENPAAYTGGTTGATDSWCAYTVALRPAVAAVMPPEILSRAAMQRRLDILRRF